jgi:C1A family cysteine protease
VNSKKGYGYIPDIPDQRDYKFAAKTIQVLPPLVDLRPKCPPVYDQGTLGSCTANAIAAAMEFDRIKQGLKDFIPSRLFIYYNERVMEHTINSDSGAMIRDGVKSVNKLGVCPESEWPYVVARFTNRPPARCYREALLDRALSYQRVGQTLGQLRGCLASGFVIILGFTVYESFESQEVANTGVVPMPEQQEAVLGGHAIVCVGYRDSDRKFICRNSWGTGWGIDGTGYFYMPYEYLTNSNLSSDFWVVQLVGK